MCGGKEVVVLNTTLKSETFVFIPEKNRHLSFSLRATRGEFLDAIKKMSFMVGESVSFGIQKLWDLLSHECERFQGVEDQVNGLKRDLNLLSSFLKDADAKKHTTAVVRNCVDEIQEIVYDAEDIIETYLLKEKLGKTSGVRKSIRRVACLVPDRRKYALNIGGIRTRISDVIRDMKNFGVQQAVVEGGYMPPQGDRQKEMRRTFPKDYESDFVGLEANVKKLVGLVEKDDMQIVSITGMGGLGKTTLARQVFNHEDVKHQFDRLAWVCVSQEFTRISVWQEILQNLTSKERKDEILKMKDAELQDELFQLLETSKSLIVFDDIWKEEDWDLIKPIFPPKKGWKVLLTSRTESVAKRGNLTYINFKLECLNFQDSWTLFQRIAMPRKDAPEFIINEEMEESAKEMIKHCGGLPLAVKVLGGLLATNYTVHDWKRLSENIGSHVVIERNNGINGSINHVLSLSFEELPSYLKHCFLCMAHFPEDHRISVTNLSYFWAAEGISKPRRYDGETIRDVADDCIEELVRRNMVITERDVMTMRFETCRLHDMMREVCLIKAKGENFVQILGSTSSSSSTADAQSGTSRRLVLHSPTTTSHIGGDLKNPKLRSLVIVWSDVGRDWTVSGLTLKRVQLLRVLDLSFANFEGGKLPSSIGKLIHLRYLSLGDAKVSHLPSSLRNLKLLIYLNLDAAYMDIFVPNVLMGMQELKYLALPCIMDKKTKLELRNLEKLETLRNFSTKNGSIEDLRGMARLRFLSIWLSAETSLETLSASISGLKHLEDLSITDRYGSVSERRIEEGIELDFIHLKRLRLDIKLPRQQRFPSHLTTISLENCGLEKDPMPILEKLLQLKQVWLFTKSFSGRRMVCSGGGFLQLQELVLYKLMEWEEWIVEEGSMPLLHNLEIWYCPKLKELPDGLRFLYSLKNLSIDKEWKERLSEGGEDYYKVKHIPSIEFR